MLLTNYSYITQILGRQFGGLTNPQVYGKPEVMRNYYTPDTLDNISSRQKDSFQTGTTPPYTIMLSDKGGNLSSTTTVTGSNLFANLNLAGGLNAESSLTSSGDLSGDLGGVVYLLSTLSGLNTLSADIQGSVGIAANLAGNGDLTGTLSALISILADLTGEGELSGNLSGALSAVSNLAGSGDLIGAIQGTVSIIANISGSSDLTGAIIGNWSMISALAGTSSFVADIEAIAEALANISSNSTLVVTSGASPGDMSANISSFSTLSPENLAIAVWAYLQTNMNNPGTAGAALLAAGSAGDPWSTLLPASYTGDQAGAILDQIKTLVDELHKIQGLDISTPMTVTPSQRSAGSIQMNITGDGENITTVTRQP